MLKGAPVRSKCAGKIIGGIAVDGKDPEYKEQAAQIGKKIEECGQSPGELQRCREIEL